MIWTSHLSQIHTRPLPTSLHLVPSSTRQLPLVGHAIRGGSVGTGVQYDFRALQIALYECFERQSFSCKPLNLTRLALSEFEDKSFSHSCRRALEQTSSCEGERLETHQFECVRCIEITTGRALDVPIVFLVLNSIEDSIYFPVVDSSGSAIHTDAASCFRSAIQEFVERQCLCLNWLTKQAKSEAYLSKYESYQLSLSRGVSEFFLERGHVKILDISHEFGCYCYLATFAAFNTDALVQYACGIGCRLEPRDALERALIELYQAYYHMFGLASGDEPSEGVQAYFDANVAESYQLFGVGTRCSISELVERNFFHQTANRVNFYHFKECSLFQQTRRC